jgi:CheY-like chemotaxis protein
VVGLSGERIPAGPTPDVGSRWEDGRVGRTDGRKDGRTILVVDDDASFRSLATRLLAAWGHHVIGEAGSVAEAVERADELRPDAVLADIALPDGDGFRLTQRLVALPWSIDVVLTSSDPAGANRLAALRAGARGFVPKSDLSDVALRKLLEGG